MAFTIREPFPADEPEIADPLERFSVMALFEPIDVGEQFRRSAWPAHVTLASNFVIAEPVEHVVNAVREANVVDRPLTFRFGERAQFGEHGDVPVRLAESRHVDDVHRELARRLHCLRGFAADEPMHWGDGYHPHLTLRPGMGVDAAEGEERAASHVAVARLSATHAAIVACLRLASTDRPEIVCICGSARFVQQMRAANRDLTLDGVIVVAPGEAEGVVVSPDQKTVLDALHLRKIDLADRVLVVNPGGYIGESTAREIAYARAAGKPVSFTDPV